MVTKLGAGETAQSAKCLPHKLEVPSVMGSVPVSSVLGRQVKEDA